MKVLAAKHTASLQLPYAVGSNQARLDARTEFKIFGALANGRWKLVVHQTARGSLRLRRSCNFDDPVRH